MQKSGPGPLKGKRRRIFQIPPTVPHIYICIYMSPDLAQDTYSFPTTKSSLSETERSSGGKQDGEKSISISSYSNCSNYLMQLAYVHSSASERAKVGPHAGAASRSTAERRKPEVIDT
jgi:hypothetical protein